MPDRWDDIRVTVVRPGPVDQRGQCANAIPQDDFKSASLQPGEFNIPPLGDAYRPPRCSGFHLL